MGVVPLVDDFVADGRRRDLRGSGLLEEFRTGFSTVFGREVRNAPRVFSSSFCDTKDDVLGDGFGLGDCAQAIALPAQLQLLISNSKESILISSQLLTKTRGSQAALSMLNTYVEDQRIAYGRGNRHLYEYAKVPGPLAVFDSIMESLAYISQKRQSTRSSVHHPADDAGLPAH